MFGLECRHYWNPSVDMVQTCSICGMERIVPCKFHKWKRIETLVVSDDYHGGAIGYDYVMQCERCGVVETTQVGY